MFLEILEFISPSIVAITTVFITNYYSDRHRTRSLLKQRIDEVFAPFYKENLVMLSNNQKFSQQDTNFKSKTINFLINNVQYFPTNTHHKIIALSQSTLDSINNNDIHNLDNLYNQVLEDVVSEYTRLTKILKLPRPLRTYKLTKFNNKER